MSASEERTPAAGTVIGIVVWGVGIAIGIVLKKVLGLGWLPTLGYTIIFMVALGDTLLALAGIRPWDEDTRVAIFFNAWHSGPVCNGLLNSTKCSRKRQSFQSSSLRFLTFGHF